MIVLYTRNPIGVTDNFIYSLFSSLRLFAISALLLAFLNAVYACGFAGSVLVPC